MSTIRNAVLACLLTAPLTQSVANANPATTPAAESPTETTTPSKLSASIAYGPSLQVGFGAHSRPSSDSPIASYDYGVALRMQNLSSITDGGPLLYETCDCPMVGPQGSVAFGLGGSHALYVGGQSAFSLLTLSYLDLEANAGYQFLRDGSRLRARLGLWANAFTLTRGNWRGHRGDFGSMVELAWVPKG